MIIDLLILFWRNPTIWTSRLDDGGIMVSFSLLGASFVEQRPEDLPWWRRQHANKGYVNLCLEDGPTVKWW